MYDKRISQEVEGEALGDEFAGYVSTDSAVLSDGTECPNKPKAVAESRWLYLGQPTCPSFTATDFFYQSSGTHEVVVEFARTLTNKLANRLNVELHTAPLL